MNIVPATPSAHLLKPMTQPLVSSSLPLYLLRESALPLTRLAQPIYPHPYPGVHLRASDFLHSSDCFDSNHSWRQESFQKHILKHEHQCSFWVVYRTFLDEAEEDEDEPE